MRVRSGVFDLPESIMSVKTLQTFTACFSAASLSREVARVHFTNERKTYQREEEIGKNLVH